MSGNENNNYLTTNETKYLTTRRVYNETRKAYIERIIKENIINFIRWNEINEKTEYLDMGDSGVIKKTKWIEKNITVVLKIVSITDELTDSDNDEFIKEIKAFHHIGLVYSSITNEENKEKTSLIGYENVIKFFGVSSDEYDVYLVLEYGDLGNLRYYLKTNTINWKQKINIARQIARGLYFLHKNEILHRDLHSKNVVIKKDGYGVKAIITDFGLSKVLPRNSQSNQEIRGSLSFIGPEISFIGPEILYHDSIHDYKSDIYSLGVVLWEITSNGRPPFDKYKSIPELSFNIMKGVRESPINGSTISYVKLYTDCWNGNPKLRPKIEQVYKLIHQEEIITGEKWKVSSQSYIHDTDIGQTTFNEKESNKDENVSDNTMAIYSEVKNAPKKLDDFRVLSNFFQEEFDNSSEDQKLVKEWKLNHGLYLAGKNFIPSSRIILGYNGKLDVVTYSGEPLVYAVVNNNPDKPRSLWDKLRDSYPKFSTTKECPVNDIFETDICLLFPIAEITYEGPINKGFMFDLNSDEVKVFITDNYVEYGHFFAKKLFAGGKLILRNFANAKPVQIENLKSHLALALDSYHLRIENPFENATIFDFPMIETTNKNFLKTPKDLAKWIKRLYEDNVAEIITYEEIVPIFTFLGKVNHIDNSNAFINRLVPGISSKHQEITLKDWIDIPLRNLLTWINKFSFRHGMLINQFGISLAKNQALTFTQTPIVSKRNSYYLKLIQPETRMEEILLRNNITHKLTSNPFLEYLSTTKIGDFYLFLNKEKIEISLDQCVAPLPVFTEAVEDAIRSIHPYRALQKVFNKFGYFFLNSAVLGSQLREILKKQMNISIQSLPEKKFVPSSQEDIDKILEYTKDLNLNYLLTPNGQVVMMNQIFDWFNEFGNNDEKLKLIKIDQITPLYKFLNYKLQFEIETILENRSDPRILLTGIKTFDVDDNFTKAFIRIDFDYSVLDSSSYDVFGVILDNEGIRSQRCTVNFDLFDCYGFTAFVTFEDNTAKNIRGWNIIWMVIGNPFLLGAFSTNYRETKTMFHKALVDFTACYDDMIYIHLPFTLAKNSIVLLSALYPPSNNPPKQDFKLIRWSKDILELKIATLNIDQTRPSTFYLNICAVYPREKMIFKVDFGEKIVTYNLFGHNIDDNNYDQFIDFIFYKNIYLTRLNVEFPVNHTEYLCTTNFGYWTIAISENDNSQLAIKHIIKRRLPDLIQNYGGDIPFEAYFMQEVKHENLVKYIDILETETTFILITELDYSIRSTSWKTLHHYLKHNGALFENQAKNIFKQIIECISFIYKHGFRNININDRNILIFESQIKLFNMENLISDELTDGLVYNIQYEDDYNISYASPEMISGHNYNPEFSDLWSLGILLYTMIHADVPFKKPFDTITRTLMIEKEISKECSNILHRLLAKKSHLRGSFKSLLNDSWIGINTFSKRRISNNLKRSTDKNIIIEKTSKNETIHELDELIEESQNNIGSSLSLQWIPSNSLKDMKLIGKGGFGSVFSATWISQSTMTQTSNKHHFHWQKTSTKVALKECINIHEDDNLKDFLIEMKNHTKINGLWGIIDFYGIACSHKHDDLKIVLHYADKSDLSEYLARNFTSITWKEKLSIILDVAAGLYQIHDRGIVHRDIHPGNIFLDSSFSCIGDFGLSRETKMLTDASSKFGVLPYMAPEVVKEGKYSYASDIYAFGILLIKIATGKHIYGANNNDKPSFDESIPSFYQNMIHSCCDKEPSNRPNAQTLTNEIIDWKLNKMHQFNDKKRLLSYLSKEAEETVEKLQTDIIPDPDIIENDENNDIYSKMKSDSLKSNAFIKSYNKAIDGDSEAMKNVAICLLNGNGIEKDMNEAFRWCMKCFRKDIVFTREELIPLVEYFSQDSLDLERKIKFARMLECGLGVDKDLVNAYLIYKSAAESGHAHAQFITGKNCEKGLGRKKDLREAFNWFIKAINQNYSDALDYINERYVASFKQQEISVNIECKIYSNKSIVTGKATKTIVKDKLT